MIFNVTNGGGGDNPVSLQITPPIQTEYSVGDILDLTGMVVKAVYTDSTTRDVTSVATISPADGSTLSTAGTVTITATFSGLTTSTNITVSPVHIYGAYWAGTSSPAWTRTDEAADFIDPNPYYAGMSGTPSSPFDNLMPWSGMVRVSDSEAGELVAIPKFWYKWTRSGDSMKLQIADKATEGFLVSPAHADRGDGKGERDVVYVGRYHCASDYKSKTGNSPKANITRSAARSGIHNLGSTIWQWDYAMLWTISMLYLVEFANWNSQAKIGYGCGNISGVQNMGASDRMPYHTGTMQSDRTTYGVGCQYRYIEGLWDNVYEWVDGIYFSSSNIYIIKNPTNFSDSSNGTNVGIRTTSSNYISKWNTPSKSDYDWAMYPSAVSGSDSTYICDTCEYSSGGTGLCAGGSDQGPARGLFCFGGHLPASFSEAHIGSRLQKLP